MNEMAVARDSHERVPEAELRPHYEKLAEDPTHHPSLRALFDLYQCSEQIDPACCVAEALTVLRKVSPGQCLYLGQHRPRALPVARQPLSEALVRERVAHPDEDPYLTAILTLIAPAVAAWRAAKPPRSLARAEHVDLQVDPSDVSRMIKYASRVLGIAAPEVYFRPDCQGDYALSNVQRDGAAQPTLVVFDGLLARRKEPELAYVIGRAMAELFVPHYAVVAVDRSPQVLQQIVDACLSGVGMTVPGDQAALGRIAREVLGRMAPAACQHLFEVVRHMAEAGVVADVPRWCIAAELTASRVALLLSGDLRIAAQALTVEPSPLCCTTMLTAKERLEDLLCYGTSEDYFFVRETLGIDALIRFGGR